MTNFQMKPSFYAAPADMRLVRVVNGDGEISVGTVSREETMMHTPEKPSYRYTVDLLGKYRCTFGGVDHVVGYLEGVSAVLTEANKITKPVRR